jgi:hypothetical protein
MPESALARIIPLINCQSDERGLRRGVYVVYDANDEPVGILREDGAVVQKWVTGCDFQSDRLDPDVTFSFSPDSSLDGEMFCGIGLMCSGEFPCERRIAQSFE